MRTNRAETIENDSVQEREERLKVAREGVRERRATNVSSQEEHVDSREEYLHQGGWEDTKNSLSPFSTRRLFFRFSLTKGQCSKR